MKYFEFTKFVEDLLVFLYASGCIYLPCEELGILLALKFGSFRLGVPNAIFMKIAEFFAFISLAQTIN